MEYKCVKHEIYAPVCNLCEIDELRQKLDASRREVEGLDVLISRLKLDVQRLEKNFKNVFLKNDEYRKRLERL